MSYKYSTGSVRRGDIYFEDDTQGEQTYIDFGQFRRLQFQHIDLEKERPLTLFYH